jgi:isopentenyl-diphosphate delta-isomerase
MSVVGFALRPTISGCIRRLFSTSAVLDPVQEALLSEPCILVNTEDEVLGEASKRECHLMQNGSSLLHRAFSLFVFNDKAELLLQQRSDSKITFPNMWTNTCCSHPLAVDGETEAREGWGARRAAQRRLEIELGVKACQAKPEDILYLTRILYQSPSDGQWGEHELDYILFLRVSYYASSLSLPSRLVGRETVFLFHLILKRSKLLNG